MTNISQFFFISLKEFNTIYISSLYNKLCILFNISLYILLSNALKYSIAYGYSILDKVYIASIFKSPICIYSS